MYVQLPQKSVNSSKSGRLQLVCWNLRWPLLVRQPTAASTENHGVEREPDMRATRYSFLLVLALVLVSAGSAFAQSALQFVAVDPPCRLIDTRSGSPLQGGVAQNFQVGGNCGVPSVRGCLLHERNGPAPRYAELPDHLAGGRIAAGSFHPEFLRWSHQGQRRYRARGRYTRRRCQRVRHQYH